MRTICIAIATFALAACGGNAPQSPPAVAPGKPASPAPAAPATAPAVAPEAAMQEPAARDAAAAPPGGSLIANPGFEQPASGDRIPGWTLSQHAGVQAYEMGIDHASAAEGKASFRMQRLRVQVYGAITQQLDAATLAGKTVELTAKVRTKDVGPRGWMVSLDAAGSRASALASGTSDWHEVQVRAKVPAGTKTVTVGAMLRDAGTGWLDDVRLRVVD